MTVARESSPPSAIALPARAKTLGKLTGAFAKKPALDAFKAEQLREERLMARALDATMSVLDVKNTEVAEWLGVSEKIVRDLRTREKVLQGRQIAKMPEDFRAALLIASNRLLRAPVANDNA